MGFLFSSYRISIHAPTRGATKDNSVKIFAIVFQSTLPRGERRRQQCRDCCLPEFQSTLPRGERRFFRRWRSSGAHFNPRSHEGSDRNMTRTKSWKCLFQSTLPRGERLYNTKVANENGDFNPRSHEGSDDIGLCSNSCSIYFNPRSHEGSDAASQQTKKCTLNFNPRSHEGSDGFSLGFTIIYALFQSTLPRGERPC